MSDEAPKPGQDALESAADFARASAYHGAWLARRRLAGRPWFILASAPKPTIPGALPPDTAHVHVKFAGKSARKLGLPPGDLTLLAAWKIAEKSKGLDLRNVLMLRPKLPLVSRINRRFGRTGVASCDLLGSERDQYVLQTLHSLFGGLGRQRRPSSGITMLAFALAHGVPRIILTGMSLDQGGYEYDASGAERRHAEEDEAALKAVAALYPQVSTTEAALHAQTGLPLFRP